uniref:Uncharacterized protein n=1 Tax=Acrobeloides nanus TaxID=290746 RepID=A0A914D306_9BILA
MVIHSWLRTLEFSSSKADRRRRNYTTHIHKQNIDKCIKDVNSRDFVLMLWIDVRFWEIVTILFLGLYPPPATS